MTAIVVNLTRPVNGARVPAPGALTWTPTSVRIIPATADRLAEVVVPEPFTVQVNGPTTINIEPTGPGWAWKVDERLEGVAFLHHVLVPDSAAPVDYGDLEDVDAADYPPYSPVLHDAQTGLPVQ